MRKRSGDGGFTMVELSVTAAIIGIIAMIAVPSLIKIVPRIRLANTAQILANEIAMARMSAIAKSADGEATFTKGERNAEGKWTFPGKYEVAKTVGGSPYFRTILGPSAGLESLTYLADDSEATAAVQLYANGTTNVPLQKQAVVITLATEDGIYKRRVVVWATGRVYTEKWTGGDSWERG